MKAFFGNRVRHHRFRIVFTYAIGKFTNGFLADRSNINRFMTTGLLITALVNLCLGFTNSFILFAILWGD